MPELPEVETLKRELVRIKGKTIRSVWINWPKTVSPLSAETFRRRVENKKIISVKRRAKILILKLDKEGSILIHLKLTGQLILSSQNLKNKFTHLILEFRDGDRLFFNDLRKFGWMRFVEKDEAERIFSSFGPEPLTKGFSFKKFKEIIAAYPQRKIKRILLDQKLIAGVGNIYADESCFCAGILPARTAGKIKEKELKKLRSCLQRIIKLAIAQKGTSLDSYIRLNGKKGNFVPFLKVYGRQGEKCRRCGKKIQKIKLNGRGTHFCPSCQK